MEMDINLSLVPYVIRLIRCGLCSVSDWLWLSLWITAVLYPGIEGWTVYSL